MARLREKIKYRDNFFLDYVPDVKSFVYVLNIVCTNVVTIRCVLKTRRERKKKTSPTGLHKNMQFKCGKNNTFDNRITYNGKHDARKIHS